MTLTRLLVISDIERAKAWYENVLGADVHGEYGATSCVVRFLDAWLLLVTGGPPTADKPGVAFEPPVDPDRVDAELIVGVPIAARRMHSSRLAARLSSPRRSSTPGRSARSSATDGHLFEISEHRRGD